MTTISIKYDDDGQIRNRYIGAKDGDEWTQVSDADWPDPNPMADNEIPLFFYDESTGEISAQLQTLPSEE